MVPDTRRRLTDATTDLDVYMVRAPTSQQQGLDDGAKQTDEYHAAAAVLETVHHSE